MACDLLIFAMKAQDMQTALSKSAHIDVRDAVISLQNGIMKDDLLADLMAKLDEEMMQLGLKDRPKEEKKEKKEE